MYRYVAGLLPQNLPLFIPDIPGYGDSTKSVPTTNTEAYSKREIGGDILDALQQHLVKSGAETPYPLVLMGHDRGARVIQRVIVDKKDHPAFNFLGAVLLDIVPIVTQFSSLANPRNAASTFHWAFLAAPHPVPESFIAALGGPKYIDNMIGAWSGQLMGDHTTPEEGVSVYMKHFEKQSVIDASCADYRAAALVDHPEQVKDQEEGRKVEVPTLVVYSKKYLGSRYDVPAVWKEWVKEGTSLTTHGVEGGVGHFIPEEAPEELVATLQKWMDEVLAVKS